jgi:hypothetical protein
LEVSEMRDEAAAEQVLNQATEEKRTVELASATN